MCSVLMLLVIVFIISGKIPTGFHYQAKLHCELISNYQLHYYIVGLPTRGDYHLFGHRFYDLTLNS